MKTDPRRFAPLGLILSLLALLSFVGILIVKGLASGNVFTLPDPKVLDQAMWISLAVILLGLGLAAFLDPEGARKFFVGRQVEYGSNSIIMLLAFLGILFFINLIAYQNPIKKDVTEDQQNSLAPETLNMIKALPKPVTANAYYSQGSRDSIQKLLDNFTQNSNGKFTYKFFDPTQDPSSAQQDGVSHDATIVLHMGNSQETSTLGTEQDIDSAIVRLINPVQRVLYFLTGQGERDTENADPNSLSQVKAALQNKNYTVKLLNLDGQTKVPADAKVVLIAGPQQPLTTAEVALLQAYQDQGGALIVMEDPRELTKFGKAADPLADMLTKWGVSLDDDIIIDTNPQNALLAYADPQNYGSHAITEKLRGFNSAFFTARSLKLATAPEGITLTTLAQTLADDWGETDIQSINDKTASFDPATDIKGPLTLAAAGENSTTKARLVVFGDSDFGTDQLYQLGNGDILINAVDWAAAQENLISLTPKNNVSRTYQQPQTPAFIAIILVSVCGIPLLVIVAGVVAWYSRRRRG